MNSKILKKKHINPDDLFNAYYPVKHWRSQYEGLENIRGIAKSEWEAKIEGLHKVPMFTKRPNERPSNYSWKKSRSEIFSKHKEKKEKYIV